MRSMSVGDFEKQIKKHKIKRWEIRGCSFCNYPISYLFVESGGGVEVLTDTGCDCVVGPSRITDYSMEGVISLYNMNAENDNPLAKRMYEDFYLSELEENPNGN